MIKEENMAKDENKNTETEEKIRAEELAEQVKLLFQFCATLIPYKDLIKKTADLSAQRQSWAVSAAVIIEAFGQNYQEVEIEKRIIKERAEAIYNLIDTLDRTEKERSEFKEKARRRAAGLAQLRGAFGL